MDDNKRVPTQGLTIYLIKESFADGEVVLSDKFNLKSYVIESGSHKIGDLYVQHRKPQTPRWAQFFQPYLDPRQLGLVASASAAFLMKMRGRLFAVTFG